MKTGVSSVVELSPERRRRQAEWRSRERQASVRVVGVTTVRKVALCAVDGCFNVVPCSAHGGR